MGLIGPKSASQAFQILKNVLVSAPVLALTDFSMDFVVETDAFGDGIGVLLMQQWQPLAFFSKALAPRHQSFSI